MLPLLAALLIGLVAGLRSMTAPAAVSWAAQLGWLDLDGSWLAFLDYAWTPVILTALAALELVGDKLPQTPSRKVPHAFATRIVSGAICGAAIGFPAGVTTFGLLAGVAGAVLGTLGGAAARARLAAAFGRDMPAALVEDAAAVGVTAVAVGALL